MIPRFVAAILPVGLLVLSNGVVFGQATSTGSGQDYPNKPVRILTGSVGGGNDSVARQIAQGISGPLGQQVIVENRPPLITTETAAKAPPDGYTLMVHGGAVWILPLLQKVNYDVARDFAPISQISREVFVVAVHPSLPVKSIKEFIALAKARPGEINYAATTPGGSVSLSAALLRSQAGINIQAVPYTGNGPALTAVVSGEVQMLVIDAGVTAPHVKAGRLRALAVTSAEPSALAPGLPSVAASGVPGYEAIGMTVIFAPAKTPAAIITRLNQELVRFLTRPEVKERFLNSGAEIVASSPEQFAVTIKSDTARWDKVIKDLGLKVN